MRGPRGYERPAGAALVVFAGLAAFSGGWNRHTAPALMAMTADSHHVGSADSNDWTLYKVTYPSPANRSADILDLINGTLAPMQTTCLGCDGVKLYATLGDGVGLHWVEAPVLTTGSFPLGELVDFFDGLLNETHAGGAWTAFMHNRVQMYTPTENLAKIVESVEAKGVRVLARKTDGYSGYGRNGTVEVAHASFALGGRVYEVAAPILDDGEVAKLTHDWPLYGATECATAARLPWNDVEELDTYYVHKVTTMAAESSVMGEWIGQRGFAPPVLLDVQVASGSAQATVANWLGMSDFMQASSRTVQDADGCVAERVSLNTTDDNFNFQASLTYVENTAAAAFDDASLLMDVTRYDAYVQAVHEATRDGSGFGWGVAWDHYLDQHVGFEYLGTGSCRNDTIELTETVISELKASNLLVAERQENMKIGNRTGLPRVDDVVDDDDNMGRQVSNHFYCGMWGAMTWEYNVVGCEGGNVVETNVCTCLPENSDRVFLDLTDSYCEEMTGGCPTTGTPY